MVGEMKNSRSGRVRHTSLKIKITMSFFDPAKHGRNEPNTLVRFKTYVISWKRDFKQASMQRSRVGKSVDGEEVPALTTMLVNMAKMTILYLSDGRRVRAVENSSKFRAGTLSLS